MIETQLFTDKDIRLTAIDPETDSTAESTWTHDLRMLPWRVKGFPARYRLLI
jgi:hypothetical protein